MNSRNNRRLVALTAAVVGATLLQACASVTTGRFVPTRETQVNRNMNSHYDVLHQQVTPGGSGFRIVSAQGGGVFDFKYY
ncbi:MAG: hypothetical protein ABJE10_23070 [bacterium]